MNYVMYSMCIYMNKYIVSINQYIYINTKVCINSEFQAYISRRQYIESKVGLCLLLQLNR